MSTTWPSWLASDTLSGEGAQEEGQHLFDRDKAMSEGLGTTLNFVSTNMTTTLADIAGSIYPIRFPDWCLTDAVVHFRIKTMRDASVSGNASYRVGVEDGTPTWQYGSTVTQSINTSWTYIDLTYTFTDDTFAGAFRRIKIQAQRPASGTDNDWDVAAWGMIRNVRFYAP